MKNAEEVTHQWMQAINTKNMEGLLSTYHETAVLIPTFSNRILNSRMKIQEYFSRLLEKEELSIALHRNTVLSQSFASNTVATMGIYCWRFAIEGELFSFEARFSCILSLDHENPIIHHHSSQIPRVI